ncbi:MAG: hypothetical protein M1839_008954 [Geoglossum umbratile]|nr:MAG: hypothetical protein M1839_008954 [Geoglossum umbratile]
MSLCSLPCYKIHRETHPEGPPQPEPPTPQPGLSQDRDATPQEDKTGLNGAPPAAAAATAGNQFAALSSSPELLTLFQKHPTLRPQLQQIFAALSKPPPPPSSPGGPRDQGRARLGRGEFQGRGRGRGGGHLWTPERGAMDGLACLKGMRELDGAEGEGVREFALLVLKLGIGEGGCLDDGSSAGNVGRGFAEKSSPG